MEQEEWWADEEEEAEPCQGFFEEVLAANQIWSPAEGMVRARIAAWPPEQFAFPTQGGQMRSQAAANGWRPVGRTSPMVGPSVRQRVEEWETALAPSPSRKRRRQEAQNCAGASDAAPGGTRFDDYRWPKRRAPPTSQWPPQRPAPPAQMPFNLSPTAAGYTHRNPLDTESRLRSPHAASTSANTRQQRRSVSANDSFGERRDVIPPEFDTRHQKRYKNDFSDNALRGTYPYKPGMDMRGFQHQESTMESSISSMKGSTYQRPSPFLTSRPQLIRRDAQAPAATRPCSAGVRYPESCSKASKPLPESTISETWEANEIFPTLQRPIRRRPKMPQNVKRRLDFSDDAGNGSGTSGEGCVVSSPRSEAFPLAERYKRVPSFVIVAKYLDKSFFWAIIDMYFKYGHWCDFEDLPDTFREACALFDVGPDSFEDIPGFAPKWLYIVKKIDDDAFTSAVDYFFEENKLPSWDFLPDYFLTAFREMNITESEYF